ncbi:MAG: hypothetical protein KDC06_09845 [Chitinophagaceae bacterium]|nr:hypothetical protein [Chitinophagaceae bacterium]
MKQLVILFLLSTCSVGLLAQNPAWKKTVIDENLTVSFPHAVIENDTTILKDGEKYEFKTFNCETDTSSLLLIISPGKTNIKVDNEESWREALSGLAKGALNSFSQNGMFCIANDTTIDEIPCKKLNCQPLDYALFNNYIFLVNDKMYSFQIAYRNGSKSISAHAEMIQFLNSIHFNKSSIKEKQFDSKAESTGYKFGKLLFPLILLVAIILILLFKFKNQKK